jgi:mono/diheme cytochrome c family protein
MKRRILKTLAFVVIFLIIGIASALTYIKTVLPNVGPPPEITAQATPELIMRGEYLAKHVMVCLDCHGTRDWSRFSGPMVEGHEGKGGEAFDQRFGFPGSFTAKNITPFNLSGWTDGELFRLITTGVNKDGKAMFPVMPYKFYGQLDEEDILAVIAYIRTLPSIESHIPESEADFPVNFLINTIPEKAKLQKRPPVTQTVDYGKYMTTASACAECHTKQEKGKVTGELLAGGFEFNLGGGNVVRSMNITFDSTGIGSWTKEQFIRRFKLYADSNYVAPLVDLEKGEMQTVMPWTMYAGMTTEDLGAIYEYLKTVPKVENKVERFTWAKKP